MVTDQARHEQETTPEEGDGVQPVRSYHVGTEAAQAQRRSLSRMLASRKCHNCQQGDAEDSTESADVKSQIERIAEHCAETSDYLLADTPLKEAIFRVIIAEVNKPMTADDIGQVLSEKWAVTPFPRNTSAEVIQRLLEHSEAYCISQVPEAED